jgi:hypothetical protein
MIDHRHVIACRAHANGFLAIREIVTHILRLLQPDGYLEITMLASSVSDETHGYDQLLYRP